MQTLWQDLRYGARMLPGLTSGLLASGRTGGEVERMIATRSC